MACLNERCLDQSHPNMGTFLQNHIVTRGLGVKRSAPQLSGIITQGYGSQPPAFVITTLQEQSPLHLHLGQSGLKRRLAEMEEIFVWAKMIELNGKPPPKEIKGWIRVRVNKQRGYAMVIAEHVGSRVRSILESIKVTATRVK